MITASTDQLIGYTPPLPANRAIAYGYNNLNEKNLMGFKNHVQAQGRLRLLREWVIEGNEDANQIHRILYL